MVVKRYDPENGRDSRQWTWHVLGTEIWHLPPQKVEQFELLDLLIGYGKKFDLPIATVEIGDWSQGEAFHDHFKEALGDAWNDPKVRRKWAINITAELPMRLFCFDLPRQNGDQWIPGEKDTRKQDTLRWIERNVYKDGDRLFPGEDLDARDPNDLLWQPTDLRVGHGMMQQWQEASRQASLISYDWVRRHVWDQFLEKADQDGRVRILNNPFKKLGPPWKVGSIAPSTKETS